MSAHLIRTYVDSSVFRCGNPQQISLFQIATRGMTRTTPISSSKTQALARVLAGISHGYTHICSGFVRATKLEALVNKFDAKYGIADFKGQRAIRRRDGRASTQLAVYNPPPEYAMVDGRIPWLLMATPGNGVEEETLIAAHDRPVWLGYELTRHNSAGTVRWSWRRPKSEMAELYAELGEDLSRHRYRMVERTLQRIANQPGFHGVRAQSEALCKYALQRGYTGVLPHLFYVQKMAHGSPLVIAGTDGKGGAQTG